jgi:mRNA interferase YafQ
MKKRSKDLAKLRTAIVDLTAGKILLAHLKDHKLVGGFAGRRECHLEPDWLLVYKLSGQEIIFERTGTHADLFR